MATLGNTPRPAYVYDTETDTWVPVGVGAHTHDYIPNTLVDAKGDILTATADNVPARLAKGADGTVLVSDSTTQTGLAWQPYGVIQVAGKNLVINGGFDIWQRGTSVSSGVVHGYSADRWVIQRGGWAGGATVSRQAGTGNIQYCARVQRDNGNTNTAGINIQSSFETVNSIPFAGQQITLSFYARSGATYSSVGNQLGCNVYSGTGTDQNTDATGFTGSTTPISSNVTLTTSWQRFSLTGTVPSNSTQLGMMFNYGPTGTAGSSDYFEITGIQLEIGPIATTFTRAAGTIQAELAACQRYYLRHSYSGTNSALIGPAYARTTGIAFATWTFPVTMRSTPTLAFSNGTQYFNLQIAGGDATFNTLSGSSVANTDRASLRADAGSHTIGQAGVLGFNNSAAWIEASAEL